MWTSQRFDKLSGHQHEVVQDISVRHTARLFDGGISVLFYDVTTLYFEADREDELRRTGFSKEGRHSNPQIILGLLVSLGGYPLAYCIHEGNKYEGHTMLPAVNEFVAKYGLENFIVVADSGLMNNANIAELEAHGYKYIIGAKIKNESAEVREWILSQPRHDRRMAEYDKGGGRRLLIGYTEDRARKDAYNRDKGIRRLEKAYRHGALTKRNINKRGYNKFLSMDGEVRVAINYDRVADDERWDGLKGYLTITGHIYGIPQPLACGASFPHSQVKDRDTPHVPLHTQTHRGARVHLLRGAESVQGAGAHVESL